jgi:transposase
VRLIAEHRGEYRSEWAAICSIAKKFGATGETLRSWVRRAEIDEGTRPGVTSEESAELKRLRRENGELCRARHLEVL